MKKCAEPRREFAVGVLTSHEGADFWEEGIPYRLHSVVTASNLLEATEKWLRTRTVERPACVSGSPAHVEVVRLRGTRLPTRS